MTGLIQSIPPKTPACIVIGDLSLDTICSIRDISALSNLAAGNDVTDDAVSDLALGGSAWLFASALNKSNASCIPIIVSPVGSDPAGQLIRARLADQGHVTEGLLNTDRPTNTCIMLYFPDRQRLMTFPRQSSPKIDSPNECIAVLDTVRADYQLVCAWISGHSLIGYSSERVEALHHVCTMVQADGGRVILDLVPHKFRDAVGDIHVIDQLGHLDGIVGEYTTFEELGLISSPPDTAGRILMISAAKQISERYGLCIVQGKSDRHHYAQATARKGELIEWYVTEFSDKTLRGLGDVLAIEGLLRLAVL